MNGLEALERLQHSPATSGIPVIALTAKASKADRAPGGHGSRICEFSGQADQRHRVIWDSPIIFSHRAKVESEP